MPENLQSYFKNVDPITINLERLIQIRVHFLQVLRVVTALVDLGLDLGQLLLLVDEHGRVLLSLVDCLFVDFIIPYDTERYSRQLIMISLIPFFLVLEVLVKLLLSEVIGAFGDQNQSTDNSSG